MKIPASLLSDSKRILDVGGWFITEPRATHVVDLMPWETRSGKLQLEALPEERFDANTWTQCDFLKPDFRLPFDDGWFDFITCGHTIEDLSNPVPLLREMQRVGQAGVIECPSRLAEQTLGIRDRMNCEAGHPHHHWITEVHNGILALYAKSDSQLNSSAKLLPLKHTERLLKEDPENWRMVFKWEETIPSTVTTGIRCEQAALEFVASQDISATARWHDRVLRGARRFRSRFSSSPELIGDWWSEMVALSRPHSKIPLD